MSVSISSLLLCVIGALVYVLAAPKAPHASELGRLTFAVALLAVLLHASYDVAIHLGGK